MQQSLPLLTHMIVDTPGRNSTMKTLISRPEINENLLQPINKTVSSFSQGSKQKLKKSSQSMNSTKSLKSAKANSQGSKTKECTITVNYRLEPELKLSKGKSVKDEILKSNSKGLKTIQSSTKSLGSARVKSSQHKANDEAPESYEPQFKTKRKDFLNKTQHHMTEKDENLKGVYSPKVSPREGS